MKSSETPLKLSGHFHDPQQGEKPSMPLSVQSVLRDPSASDWLKCALYDASNRDCVDALNDAETLVHLLKLNLPKEGI